jgi:hypothetical protein
MSRRQYMITVNPEADPDRVATELRSKGFQVNNVMKEIRVISASADALDPSTVQELHGVDAVEEEGGIQLPPPESPIQ